MATDGGATFAKAKECELFNLVQLWKFSSLMVDKVKSTTLNGKVEGKWSVANEC